jgi:hypothetical protein
MDFIERWLGFSPDGGDGSTELLYLLVAAAISVLILWRWRARRLARSAAQPRE